jgi:SAM-dependent methyltransferase
MEHDTVSPDVETSSAEYGQRFRGGVGRLFLEAQAQAVSSLLDRTRKPRLRVLEVGGGHAQLTPLLLARGCDIWVQGSATSCARLIRPMMERFGGRLHFVSSSLWSLPFPDRSFDLVCAVRVLSHVEAWRELLAEMARVSRGSLLIDYAPLVGPNLLKPVLFGLKRRIEGNTRPYFCYTASTLERHLTDLGFDRTIRRKELLIPMGLHRLIGSEGFSSFAETFCRRIGLTALLGSPVIVLAEGSTGSHGTSPRAPAGGSPR